MDDKEVIKIIKKVMPSVVSIAIAKKLEDLERDIPKELYPFLPTGPDGKKKLEIPDGMVDQHGMVEIGGGSGCIVDPNGLILTNKHVIDDPNAEYTVILNDGRRFPGKVLTRDPINDVAVLKIEAGGLPWLKFGNAAELELGQTVIAIGNALGIFKNTVSKGIVSGLSRAITAQADPTAPAQEMRGLIQTDAAINPGNSGGPLVNADARIVGINAAIVSGAQSIGFAIPVNAARRDLDDLRKFGRIRRPLLGLRYVMIDEALKQKMKLPADHGAFVVRESQNDHGVIPGSPAEKAGVQEKDIVLEMNGNRLDREHLIQDFLENANVGDVVKLSILRNGEPMSVNVTLEERK
ncbi:MAG: trypsin-like peptidase domain-containing protein [Patescibacteria group bacterium]|nr:trypsin-like peptidase domain-containing protein [Patescibacteria group bacterium]